jgi:lysophospholipase L1-like esterase
MTGAGSGVADDASARGAAPVAPARRAARLRARVGLALGAVAAAALLAEIVLRVFFPVVYMAPSRRWADEAWLEGINTGSAVPGLDYELRPGISAWAHGALVRTNSAGMRDRERPRAKPAGTLRIAAVGDSFTFGFGVAAEDAYPSVLETLLREGAPPGGPRYEVLNFGVGGYSTQDEALVVRHKVVEWEPDLIVLGYVANDPETDPIQPLHAYYHEPAWWQHSHVLRLAAQMRNVADVRRYGGGDYVTYLHRCPEKWRSVVDAFYDISVVAKRREIPVVVAVFPLPGDLAQQVERAARDCDFSVVHVPFPHDPAMPSELADGHPNPYGHRRAAEAIRDVIVRERLLAR